MSLEEAPSRAGLGCLILRRMEFTQKAFLRANEASGKRRLPSEIGIKPAEASRKLSAVAGYGVLP